MTDATDLVHGFPFDPTYGYDLPALLAVEPPPEPPGYEDLWVPRYDKALVVDPEPRLTPSADTHAEMVVWDLEYTSTDGFPIRGWLLEPRDEVATRGFVVGHGYGGLAKPEISIPRTDAVYLVPCLRGLSRSARAPISANPAFHVLHDLHLRDRYVVGGCVEDVWTAVSALAALRPDLEHDVAFVGHSFGAGVGTMAMAWDHRIVQAHLDVPSFGHQPLRLRLPTTGSGAAVQSFASRNDHVADTLAYYDAAVAARRIRQPMLLAAALFDPVVIPPGQFAIHNALPGPKELFVRTAGHFTFAGSAAEDRDLLSALRGFFSRHEPRTSPLVQRASSA